MTTLRPPLKTPSTPPSPPATPQGALKWLITLTAALGAMLEVIDTSIVNVALNDIQATLGATVSEVGWVVTAYGIANVVLIPLSAWLGSTFGKKSYFVFSMIGFTLSSVLCGLSVNLPMLVVARILQGLCGGGLLAKAQAILFETFPPAEQGVAQAVFGVGVIAGPAIGPTLGGVLTDTLGWRWIFFINFPIGIVAVVMALLFLPPDEQKTSKQKVPVDWWGIAFLVAAVGGFQTVLEEGQKEGWLGSKYIVTLIVVSIVSFGLFIWRELNTPAPAVDLRVLRHRSLAAGSLYSGVVGMGLYGTLFAVPLFTQGVLRFSATQTGFLLAPGAFTSAIMMIIMGKVSGRIDPRILIGCGAIGSTLVMFSLAGITPQSGTDDLFMPLLWRGGVTVMMFLPLSLASLGGLPKQDISAGSGFYNLMRQLGGSLGIAILTTLLAQREAFHRAVLSAKLTDGNIMTQDRLFMLDQLFQTEGADPVTAHQRALAVLQETIGTQAAVLSYSDIFHFVGVMFICSLPLLLFLGKGNAGTPAPDVH